MMRLFNGDCFAIMPSLEAKGVDLILVDPPYGITDAKWDKALPFDAMWSEFNRLISDRGNIVIFSSMPYTARLICSNLRQFRYSWIWLKNTATNFQNAKYRPMSQTEDICVFYPYNYVYGGNEGKHKALREYMFAERKKSCWKSCDLEKFLGNSMVSHYFTRGKQFRLPTEADYKRLQVATGCFSRPYSELKAEWDAESVSKSRPYYFPQGIVKLDKPRYKNPRKNALIERVNLKGAYCEYTNFPKNVLQFKKEIGPHPTLKPVPLLEYLIKTYTQEGMTVLDCCMGSGSTGKAALNLGREFIGIEADPKYFKVAQERLEQRAA